MAGNKHPRLREVFYQVHLWTGIAAAVLLVPICLTGSYLVWHIPIDSALNPERAVAADAVARLEPEQYIAAAAEAYPDANPGLLAMPEGPGEAVNVVVLYPERAEPGAQQHRVFTWIDPATGRVIDGSDTRNTFIAWAHRFHFYLTADPVIGRQVVGAIGILLVVSCLTALYLWWPKLRDLWRSLSWQKRVKTSQNLHFVFGIWILVPMLILALTGVYLAFPETSKALVARFATIEEPIPIQEPEPSRPLATLRLAPAEAIDLAKASVGTDAELMRLTVPSIGSEDWFVLLKQAAGPPVATLVNDRDGTMRTPPPPGTSAAGDRFTHLMHALHDGHSYGVYYQTVIVIAGLLPALFLVTGVILWLRRRHTRRRAALNRAQRLAAAKPLAVALLAITLAADGGASEPGSAVHVSRASYFDFIAGNERAFRIFVAEPEGVMPESGYPVVYVNDADTRFIKFVETLRLFSENRETAESSRILLVGIGYPDGTDIGLERGFDLTPPLKGEPVDFATGGADGLLDFINDDLKPWLRNRYEIDEQKEAIYGHSFGGLFGLYALFTRPESFDYYLLSSPSIWWDRRSILAYAEASAVGKLGALSVFFTVGEFEETLDPASRIGGDRGALQSRLAERGQVTESRTLAERLAANESLSVKHAVIAGEDHATVVPAAIVRQLKWLLRTDAFSVSE